MRHGKRRGKLNRTSTHRRAMLFNMSNSLICHEQIVTTVVKAKQLRPVVEKMITLAKVGSMHARRLLLARLNNDADAVQKLIAVLAPRYINRAGGYVRIMKYKFRPGDTADMAVIEFVERNTDVKGVALSKQAAVQYTAVGSPSS